MRACLFQCPYPFALLEDNGVVLVDFLEEGYPDRICVARRKMLLQCSQSAFLIVLGIVHCCFLEGKIKNVGRRRGCYFSVISLRDDVLDEGVDETSNGKVLGGNDGGEDIEPVVEIDHCVIDKICFWSTFLRRKMIGAASDIPQTVPLY